MKAFMCDVCGKAVAAREQTEDVTGGFGFSLGSVTVERPPVGWFGVARVVEKGNASALCCSTDCVLRFVHRKEAVST